MKYYDETTLGRIFMINELIKLIEITLGRKKKVPLFPPPLILFLKFNIQITQTNQNKI